MRQDGFYFSSGSLDLRNAKWHSWICVTKGIYDLTRTSTTDKMRKIAQHNAIPLKEVLRLDATFDIGKRLDSFL